jgi:predicted alpha/beta hydrolase family esterase
MNRAIIVHCWEGIPNYCWYPWLKRELESKGFHVEVPAMPDTDHPRQDAWVPKLREVIGEPDEGLILIGHSVGCITILRYLERLKPDQRIKGVILVAGFTDDLGYEELKNYFETPIDFETIKSCCPKFIAIHSDNDPYVDMKHADIFKEKLDAKIIVKKEMGHFSGEIEDEQACTELPDVLEIALHI